MSHLAMTQTFRNVGFKFVKTFFVFTVSQNNLNYAICIKRQWNYCAISYSNEAEDVEYDFQLINVDGGNSVLHYIRCSDRK